VVGADEPLPVLLLLPLPPVLLLLLPHPAITSATATTNAQGITKRRKLDTFSLSPRWAYRLRHAQSQMAEAGNPNGRSCRPYHE
jgi:hypothetical protein